MVREVEKWRHQAQKLEKMQVFFDEFCQQKIILEKLSLKNAHHYSDMTEYENF